MDKRKVKWTEYVPWNGNKPEDYFIVCLPCDCTSFDVTNEYDGDVVRAKLDAVVDTLVEKGVPVKRSYSYAGDTLELLWKDKQYAYPVMDATLRSGFGVFTQTRMCINLRPETLNWYGGGALTPETLERIHVRMIRERIEEYKIMHEQRKSFNKYESPLVKAMMDIIYSNKIVFSHPNAWVTEEGRALVAWILETLPDYEIKRSADESDEETTMAEMKSLFGITAAAIDEDKEDTF